MSIFKSIKPKYKQIRFTDLFENLHQPFNITVKTLTRSDEEWKLFILVKMIKNKSDLTTIIIFWKAEPLFFYFQKK